LIEKYFLASKLRNGILDPLTLTTSMKKSVLSLITILIGLAFIVSCTQQGTTGTSTTAATAASPSPSPTKKKKSTTKKKATTEASPSPAEGGASPSPTP
jgi:cytoskeletal protein RodZ